MKISKCVYLYFVGLVVFGTSAKAAPGYYVVSGGRLTHIQEDRTRARVKLWAYANPNRTPSQMALLWNSYKTADKAVKALEGQQRLERSLNAYFKTNDTYYAECVAPIAIVEDGASTKPKPRATKAMGRIKAAIDRIIAASEAAKKIGRIISNSPKDENPFKNVGKATNEYLKNILAAAQRVREMEGKINAIINSSGLDASLSEIERSIGRAENLSPQVENALKMMPPIITIGGNDWTVQDLPLITEGSKEEAYQHRIRVKPGGRFDITFTKFTRKRSMFGGSAYVDGKYAGGFSAGSTWEPWRDQQTTWQFRGRDLEGQTLTRSQSTYGNRNYPVVSVSVRLATGARERLNLTFGSVAAANSAYKELKIVAQAPKAILINKDEELRQASTIKVKRPAINSYKPQQLYNTAVGLFNQGKVSEALSQLKLLSSTSELKPSSPAMQAAMLATEIYAHKKDPVQVAAQLSSVLRATPSMSATSWGQVERQFITRKERDAILRSPQVQTAIKAVAPSSPSAITHFWARSRVSVQFWRAMTEFNKQGLSTKGQLKRNDEDSTNYHLNRDFNWPRVLMDSPALVFPKTSSFDSRPFLGMTAGFGSVDKAEDFVNEVCELLTLNTRYEVISAKTYSSKDTARILILADKRYYLTPTYEIVLKKDNTVWIGRYLQN